VPQFIAPGAFFLRQGVILGATFVILAAVNALLYTLLAGQMSSLVRRPSVRKGFNRAGGGVLMGAGEELALKR
jgi:threonine/homoserine/homoserine lactone efflux protein